MTRGARASGKPDDLRATELRLGRARMLVFSMPADDDAERALSHAEGAICARLLAGATAATIASERGTHPRTVRKQIASIYRKLDVRSRRELVARLTAI